MVNKRKISNVIYYLFSITIISLIAISLTKDFKSIDDSLPGFGGDAEQYFATAYNLARYNTHDYDTTEDPKPSNYREPFYPFVLSIFWKVSGLNEDFSYECLTTKNSECFYLVKIGKILNIFFKIIFLIFSFFFLQTFRLNKYLSLIVVMFISFNPITKPYLNSYLLDYFSSLMFLVASMVFYFTLTRPNTSNKKIILYGLVFSLLIMTKFVYFYSIYILLISTIFIFLIKLINPHIYSQSNYIRFLSIKNLLIFSLIALSIPNLWKIRSYLDTGYFELSPRGSGALLQRLEHLTMTDDEFRAGQWLYFFDSKLKDEKLSKINPNHLSRYELSCNSAENWYCIHETDNGIVLKRLKPEYRNINSYRMKEGIKVLKENFISHLKLTILFLERSTFGLLDLNSRSLFNEFYKYFFVASFIFFPILFLYFLIIKRINMIILGFPLLFHFSIHSLLTHYEPRYNIIIINFLVIYFFISVDFILKQQIKKF
jgi:hypothetical protein